MYKIKQGNCLDVMKEIPDQSIDLILTDPPYNISRKNNFATMGRTGIDFGEWDKGFDQISWLEIATKKIKVGGSLIIFNSWGGIGEIIKNAESLNLQAKDVIRWVKSNPMPRNRDRRYITDSEVAIWLTNKKGKWTFNRQNDTYDRPEYNYPIVSGKEKTKHPTQKPVKLLEEILLRHSNQNDIILDPFMGSGSTGVACLNTNRNFIGVELDKQYFEIAKSRMSD